ncbi:MAG: GNAT family N-acetyltransferase [Candidatus Heimdallarchaeaceae archaeon]
MEIEQLKIEQYHEVYELWKKARIGLGWSDSEDGIRKMIERNPDLCLIGKENGKIVAVVLGGWDGRRGYVHHLAVDSACQGRGYGTQMMKELMKRFLEMRAHKVHLFVEKYNAGVVDFYKKQGWFVRDDLIMMSFDLKKEHPEYYNEGEK